MTFKPGKLTPRRIAQGLDWRARRLAVRARSKLADLWPHGSSFEQAILRRFGIGSVKEVTDPTVKMWLDFALTSIGRGREAVGMMGGRAAFRGKRVLDVGCAYGGFLVAAKEAGAAEVTGVDIDADLLDLARLQMADRRIQAHLAEADVTDPASVAPLGRFDIILCNDVIEHVTDPEACAVNLASLLVPGGSAFLQIPNGQAVDYLRRDGHYGLFGITLLDRAAAERWWFLHYGHGDRYGVEHYAPLPYYVDIFSRTGLSVRLLAPFPDAGQLDEVVSSLDERFSLFERELDLLSHPDGPDLVEAIGRRGHEEIERFRRLRDRYRQSSVAAERVIMGRTLYQDYQLTFWQLKAQRLGG